jgi:very-short-patch-repair endonuclease
MTNLMSERARRMRREKGPAEHKLWLRLREFNRHGYQFRQQAPIGPYIADFCDHSAKLIVEVDGAQHDEPQNRGADRRRTQWLESHGYRVLRFWNYEVLTNIGGVEIAIMVALGILNEDGTNGPACAPLVPSPLERLRKNVRRLARQRTPRGARSAERSGQGVSHRVPSPLVGEGQGGGESPTSSVRLSKTSDVVSPPTPNPSPQGGGESAQRPRRGPETHNG